MLRRPLWIALTAISAGAALGAGAGLLGDSWWVFEAVGAFRVQYFWVLLAAAATFGIGRRTVPCSVFGSCALTLLVSFAGAWFGGVPGGTGPRHRALVLNVDATNERLADVVEYVRGVDPDFVVLLEVTPRWLGGLEPLRQAYPYVVAEPRTDRFGIAVLSKRPLEDARIAFVGDAGLPTIVAKVGLAGKALRIIGTHPLPPTGDENLEHRNRQLDRMGPLARDTNGPTMLLGDLNATPWSPAFRRLVRASGLRDSREGFGMHATWPSWAWFMRVPLDHVLVSSDIAVHEREVGPDVGSDHLPVLVEFSLL